MGDMELPVMSDEMVDAVVRRVNRWAADVAVSRRDISWAALRAAFPAPRPPRPQGRWFSVIDGGAYVECAEEMRAADAAAALAELQACVDWITEETKSDG